MRAAETDDRIIETRRLTLRPVQAEDAGRVARLCDDYAIPSMTCRMPWPYARADADAFVGRAITQDRRRDATFAIDLEGEGMIGVVGFFTAPDAPCEVGYWLGRPWWGRGLATEALIGAVGWADRVWRKRRVVAGHFIDNPASAGVLNKAGFLYTGVVEHKPSLARGCGVDTKMMVWLA